MKKIKNIFRRTVESSKFVTREIEPESQWVFDGEGVATEKFDGSACLVFMGEFYRRLKKKAGVDIPGWIHWTVQDREAGMYAESGHGWIPVGDHVSDQYHRMAWEYHRDQGGIPQDGTYEIVGPSFQRNPYDLDCHELWRHGRRRLVDAGRTYEDIRFFLAENYVEGIVFHHEDGRMAKTKRVDFGIKWPDKGAFYATALPQADETVS